MIFCKSRSLCLLVFIFFLSFGGRGQNSVFNKLKKVEQNNREKLEIKATRYTKVFTDKPHAYYFLSRDQLFKFKNETDEKKQFRYIQACIKYATNAQERLRDSGFEKNKDWLAHRNEIKHLVYFYLQENNFSDKNARLRRKYYLFMSYGEYQFLRDSELQIEFPEEEKIDTLYYGLPTGKEITEVLFLDEEQKMLDMINAGRKKLDLSMITIDSSLSSACRYHAYDMGTQNYEGHTGYDLGADGKVYFANRTFDRIRQFYNSSRVLNENISMGTEKAYFTYKRWFKSPAHYKNLFNPQNNKVGIGLVFIANSKYKYYWVFNAAE